MTDGHWGLGQRCQALTWGGGGLLTTTHRGLWDSLQLSIKSAPPTPLTPPTLPNTVCGPIILAPFTKNSVDSHASFRGNQEVANTNFRKLLVLGSAHIP